MDIWSIKTSASKPLRIVAGDSLKENPPEVPCGQPKVPISKRMV